VARVLVAAGLVCASALLAAGSGGAGGGKAAYAHSLLNYGDSLALGTAPYLPVLMSDWQLRQVARVGRRSTEAPPFLRRLGSELPRVVLVSLGTNDYPGATDRFASTVREVVEIAGPSRCVVWASIVRPPQQGISYDGYNVVLAQARRQWSTFRVLPWARMAREHPEWLRRDGVHPSADGYRVRAEALAQLARTC
jgi:hypothetical protein